METGRIIDRVRAWSLLAVSVAILAVLGYGLFELGALFLQYVRKLEPAVGAALIGGLGTVLAGVGGTLVTQYQIKRRQAEEAHREAKIALYSRFVNMAASYLAEKNPNLKKKPTSDAKKAGEIFQFKTDLILRGSPGVIRALREFEDASNEGNNAIGAVDNIYREIRKDIGLSNWGLVENELTAIYIKYDDRKNLIR